MKKINRQKYIWLSFGLIPFSLLTTAYIIILALTGQLYPFYTRDFFEGVFSIAIAFFIPGCLIGILYQLTKKERKRYILGWSGIGFAFGFIASLFLEIFLLPVLLLLELFVGIGESAGWAAMGFSPFFYAVIFAFIAYLVNRRST